MGEKKLYRSCSDNIVAGVAGGMGQYFAIDPVLVRLIFVLLAFAGGAGVVLYIIAWVIIPEDPKCKSGKEPSEQIKEKAEEFAEKIREGVGGTKKANRNDDGKTIIGLVILAVGTLFLVQNVFGFNAWAIFWPLVIIAVGLSLIFGSRKNK